MTLSSYHEVLQSLSEGSVTKHFDPYVDIDWDSPEFAVHSDDPRWIMPEEDPLGRHPWYKAQPVERQIAIHRLDHVVPIFPSIRANRIFRRSPFGVGIPGHIQPMACLALAVLG